MKFIVKTTTEVTLTGLENRLVYTHSGNDVVDIKLPLKVKLISEVTSYISEHRCLLDYSPTALGYYWIKGDQCLRTARGLVFKTVKKEQAIQTRFNTKDNSLIYQNVDWQKSVRPTNEKEYTFNKTSQLNGLLNKSETNEWYLEIDGEKFYILEHDLEFCYEDDDETGFELIRGSISYYGRPLANVDVDSFQVLNCNYAMDKNSAFCGESVLPNADINTFEALTYGLAKDKNQVYTFSGVLKQADPQSLQLFKDHTSLFFKDKNYIFEGENILIGADIDSFKTIGEIFGVDKNYVYRYSKRQQHIDVSTFEVINSTYIKDKNNIYHSGFFEKPVCENDLSFEDLGDGYYELKNAVYYYGGQSTKLTNDSRSFQVLLNGWAKNNTTLFLDGEEVCQGDTSSVKIISEDYALINKKIFWRHDEIKNVDPDTFVTDVCDFSMDKDHIYHKEEQITGSDPDSFEQIDEFYFKDKNNVYLLSKYDGWYFFSHIKNIDTSSLEILSDFFVKNNDVVYCGEKQIIGADPLSFEVVQDCFSQDKNSVYYLDKKLSKLNPKNFKILNFQFICDEKIVFNKSCKLKLDAKYRVLLAEDFIKDKNNVYFQDTLIKDADAQSFEVINHWFQKDKHRLYHQTKPLKLNPKTTKIKGRAHAFDENNAYFLEHRIKGVDMASYEVLESNFSRDKSRLFHREDAVEMVDAPSFKIMGYSVFQDKNNTYTMEQGKLVIDGK